jgi:hypothetical protein
VGGNPSGVDTDRRTDVSSSEVTSRMRRSSTPKEIHTGLLPAIRPERAAIVLHEVHQCSVAAIQQGQIPGRPTPVIPGRWGGEKLTRRAWQTARRRLPGPRGAGRPVPPVRAARRRMRVLPTAAPCGDPGARAPILMRHLREMSRGVRSQVSTGAGFAPIQSRNLVAAGVFRQRFSPPLSICVIGDRLSGEGGGWPATRRRGGDNAGPSGRPEH